MCVGGGQVGQAGVVVDGGGLGGRLVVDLLMPVGGASCNVPGL